jgi:transposase InsO family protein
VGRAREDRQKKGPAPVSRRAEVPGQTANVDLCFVPATHEVQIKLPAVSGSSGRLVVERPQGERAEADYPGRIFADDRLDYVEAMHQFVAASQAKAEAIPADLKADAVEQADRKAHKQALRREAEALTAVRRQVRARRQQEDEVWRQLKAHRRDQQAARKAQRKTKAKPAWETKKVQDEQWSQLRQQRRLQIAQRQQEDDQWRHQRQDLRQRQLDLPLVTAWIAILVITDNCTRQCLGVPLFVAGPKVTAEMVVETLRALLPPELQFLISDRGTHFTAQLFKQLERDQQFLHVLIARHRPQSNGIAERFVQTLKAWLKDKSWQDEKELAALLAQFLAEYNDRPHQGLPIPGLSPNEFEKRIWLM